MAKADPTKPPAAKKQFFTVVSANKMLPLVRSIAEDIVEKFREARELHERNAILQDSRREAMTQPHREEVEQVEGEMEKATEDLRGLMAELRGLGVELKGPDTGLVDFPAILDGREICLCWKVGEPEVGYWHELEAGYAGRQHLTAEMPIGRGTN